MKKFLSDALTTVALASLACLPLVAAAQEFPAKPVRLVVLAKEGNIVIE